MEPALTEGRGLLALRTRGRARVGQLRVFEHPDQPGFWLVKRVAEVLPDGRMRVLSDNASATIADSRTFGPIPARGTYRVVAVV
jgi:hypothetical protein